MNTRSKQVLFLLLIIAATFLIAGLMIWQLNNRFMAEKALETAETKWDATYGDGRYDTLKAQMEDCRGALKTVEDETAALRTQISSDEEKIAVELQTIETILGEIHAVLEQSSYVSLFDEYLDLQTRFSALSEKYNALKGAEI